MLLTRAPAKVNWTLEVLGKRPDGYHEIASVMSTVSLFDELTLVPAEHWSATVDAPEPLRTELQAGANLVERVVDEVAIRLSAQRGTHGGARLRAGGPLHPPRREAPLRDAPVPPDDICGPAHIHLVKRIAAAAGLGGGSSDAAAALRLLYRFRRGARPCRFTPSMLGQAAASLGSDVPFFLHGGTALVLGRGERSMRLPGPAGRWLVLLTPPMVVAQKTARLYGLLAPRDFTDGARSQALARRFAGVGRTEVADDDLFNTFERVAPLAFPGIEAYGQRLREVTGGPPHLCGAGPSLFALVQDARAARAAAAVLRGEGFQAWAVDTVSTGRAVRVRTLPQT